MSQCESSGEGFSFTELPIERQRVKSIKINVDKIHEVAGLSRGGDNEVIGSEESVIIEYTDGTVEECKSFHLYGNVMQEIIERNMINVVRSLNLE